MLVLCKTFCVNFVWKVWCKYGFKRLWGYCLNIIFMLRTLGKKTCNNLKQLYQEKWMNAILDSGRKKYFCVKYECQGYPGNTRLLSSRPLWHLVFDWLHLGSTSLWYDLLDACKALLRRIAAWSTTLVSVVLQVQE